MRLALHASFEVVKNLRIDIESKGSNICALIRNHRFITVIRTQCNIMYLYQTDLLFRQYVSYSTAREMLLWLFYAMVHVAQ